MTAETPRQGRRVRFSPKRRAARGAAVLDRVMPDWTERIVTGRLAMDSRVACILGQIYGDFNEGCRTLALTFPDDVWFSAAALGFTVPDELQDTHAEPMGVILDRFRRLADAWRAEIARRIAGGPRS